MVGDFSDAPLGKSSKAYMQWATQHISTRRYGAFVRLNRPCLVLPWAPSPPPPPRGKAGKAHEGPPECFFDPRDDGVRSRAVSNPLLPLTTHPWRPKPRSRHAA